MALRRFFGGGRAEVVARPDAPSSETATIRRIVGELESLPAGRARHLAGFAYILGRAANSDMVITNGETALMERIVVEHGGIPEAQAVLVVEIAKQQERLFGGTEDFLVTRQWTEAATADERIALLRCCFLIGAVDDTITADESAVLNEIGNELLLDPATIARIRGEFTDRYAAVQAMRAAGLANSSGSGGSGGSTSSGGSGS
jgi:uncharacterized tellurite resistance protein B-like protein